MNATLQTHSLRKFKNILQCIAKFGDELQVQATHNELSLSAVNSSKSAFCLFLLDAGTFFHRYELTGSAAEGGGGIKCKLLVKSVLSVLGRGTQSQNVDTLQLQIIDADGVAPTRKKKAQSKRRGAGKGRADSEEDEEDELDEGRSSLQAKLILVLHCKHGVLKKHSLNLSPCECLIAEVDPSASPNNFTVPARTLKDWIEHFSVSSGSATITTSAGGGSNGSGGSSIKYENELGWYFAQNEIRVKTLEANRPPALRQYLSTEIKIAPDEFDEYHIEEGPVQLAFPLREFRASFHLAEQWGIPIDVKFGRALDPLVVNIDVEGVQGEFIMATIESDAFPADGPKPKQQGNVKAELKPDSANQKRQQTKLKPTNDAANQTNGDRNGTTSNKRKRKSLSLVEGQPQGAVSRQQPTDQPNALMDAGVDQEAERVGPSHHDSQHINLEQEFDLDADFQPNGTLHPAEGGLPNDDDASRSVANKQPLFFSTQEDGDDADKTAERQALMQQSQAEVDALDPDVLKQMMDDDPDITMEGGEESYLGPTQPAVEHEPGQGSSNRRSYHALFDD
ncbi:hypothetical protein QFC22_001072 [Naganishia vaughanmartiniae]|uniref:Uncharacterized protein n=1 Tax=Naganishia vaughanmartiniae TaxID=1424756 RepID=A0ACC2XLZ0_9TREE|nr:hypothetical protein QFC22_001072 [Naganishia vaughanmartiniae]